MLDKNKKQLHIGDIIEEDIYTIVGEKIGSVLAVIKKTKQGLMKEIIADNGGVGYHLKKQRGKLSKSDFSKIKRIGYNYKAKPIN